MEVLEAYDLTLSYRSAAELCGVDHHTVARYVAARQAGLDPLAIAGPVREKGWEPFGRPGTLRCMARSADGRPVRDNPQRRSAHLAATVATTIALTAGLTACGSSHRSVAPPTTSGTVSPTTPPAPTTTPPVAPTTTGRATTTGAPTTTSAPMPSTTGTQPPPTTATVGECTTAQLALAAAGGFGAGGESYVTYELTNNGPTKCTMTGYPGFAVLDARGRVVQKPAVREPAPGTSSPVAITLVTLAVGQKAKFVVTSVDNTPNPDCPALYRGRTLQVYPPNQTVAIRRPYNGRFCDLSVGPVQAVSG
jgi:hypothetical protein